VSNAETAINGHYTEASTKILVTVQMSRQSVMLFSEATNTAEILSLSK